MLVLTFINALRASNLINMTLNEAQAAQQYDELDANVFKNAKYKASLIYGSKIILVPTLTYNHLQLYIKFLHPMLILDTHGTLRDRPLFVTSKQDQTNAIKSELLHNVITSQLSKCFQKAGVFENKPLAYKRVSHSRIRFSITTKLVVLIEDNLGSIAHFYGKRGVEVCRKHYIQFYSNRKAAELSWKSCNMNRMVSKQEKKALDTRLQMLSKKKLPSPTQIDKWHKEK